MTVDVIEHGSSAPRRPRRTAGITLLVLAVAGLAIWHTHHQDGDHHAITAPLASASPVQVLAHFSSDTSQGFNNGDYLLQFVLVNDNSRDVTALTLPLPTEAGITASATLLASNQFGLGDPAGLTDTPTPMTLPRGGSALYALHGHVTCATEPPAPESPASPALVVMDGRTLRLPLPLLGNETWASYLQAMACRT